MPSTHASPDLQLVPHEPQFLESEPRILVSHPLRKLLSVLQYPSAHASHETRWRSEKLRHRSVQSSEPAAQSCEHSPFTQAKPLGQALSQAPQCPGSVILSTQRLLHTICVPGHSVEHSPSTQACPDWHVMSHEPQCLASAERFAHPSGHTSCPSGHTSMQSLF